MINFNKEIWEGWRVKDFIDYIEPFIDARINSIHAPKNKKELAKLCAEEQPYYKKVIPDVVDYFSNKYNIN